MTKRVYRSHSVMRNTTSCNRIIQISWSWRYKHPGGYTLIWPIRGCATGQGMVFGLFVLNRVYDFARVCPNYKQGIACPKQGNKIEVVVLNRVCILGFSCPKQGQGFKPSVAHLYPNMGQLPPRVQTSAGKLITLPIIFQILYCHKYRHERLKNSIKG